MNELKLVLPQFVIDGLRYLKGRKLTRHIPRTKYELCNEDRLASGDLSIIVPIHDSPKVTRRCLKSLEKYAPKAQIILVDDASKMRATKNVLAKFSRRNNWTVIRNDQALGHSVCSNRGAQLANHPFLCLLNSDTVFTPWSWWLIREQLRKVDIAVVGPTTSNSGNAQESRELYALRTYLSDDQINNVAAGLARPQSAVEDLPWVSGFAFLIKRHIWEGFGGFDENLPDYGNEKELCARITKIGYRIVWAKGAYIHHFGRMSYQQTIGDEAIEARIDQANNYISEKGSATARSSVI